MVVRSPDQATGAEVAVRHAQGQAGAVPPEPAGQARGLLGPLGHRGRSALQLHQCGLPKQMALELFKPFVMKRLVDLNHGAEHQERQADGGAPAVDTQVWDVLEGHHRTPRAAQPGTHAAPTGIQAFEPQLIERARPSRSTRWCTAFNADFDGDQMAVHLPLSAEAQAEARILMLSSNNILSPANGKPITTPTQDMVLGIYFLTSRSSMEPPVRTGLRFDRRSLMARDARDLHLQASIKIRLAVGDDDPTIVQTTLGRALFNRPCRRTTLVNEQVDKGRLGALVNDLSERYGKSIVAQTLDALKEIGFYWAPRSGSPWRSRTSHAGLKAQLLAAAEEQGGEGRDPVPPRSTRRRRASS